MATASYKTVRTFIGNGSQTTYNFAMDYLRKPFIVLVVDGVTKTFSTNYLINDQEMSILEAPPLGSTVVIKRVTTTDRLVVWEDASVLRASDMTIFELQLLHLQEEISDAVQTDAGEYADQAFVSAGIAKSEADRAEGIAEETAEDVTTLLGGYVQAISDAKDIVVPLVPIVQQAVIDAQQAVLSAQQAVTDAKSLGAVPVGMVVSFLTPVAPAGFLMMSGVNRVSSFDPLLYPDLYTALGNVNTLPDTTNKFPEGAGDHVAGGAVKAWRLPAFTTNTTGAHTHPIKQEGGSVPTGVGTPSASMFGANSGSDNPNVIKSAGDHAHTLSIPAGNLDTYLAPDAFGVYWAIKAFGAVSNEGTAQIGALVATVDTIKENLIVTNNAIEKITPIALGDAPIFACRAWANFNGITGELRAGGNIANVVKNGTGDYTLHLVIPLVDAFASTPASGNVDVTTPNSQGVKAVMVTPSTIRVLCNTGSNTPIDMAYISIVAFR